jgi:hypothetical protein
MKKMYNLITLLVTAMLVVGCSPSFMTGGETEFNTENAKKIVAGKTTKQEVLALLGQANNTQVSGDIDIWVYKNFTQTKGWVPGHIKEQTSEHLQLMMQNNKVIE